MSPRNEKTYFLHMRKQRHRSAAASADLPLCFHFINSTCTIIRIFKPLAICRGCTAWFVSDLVGNPKDRLSHDAAQCYFFVFSSLCCYQCFAVDLRLCFFAYAKSRFSHDEAQLCHFMHLDMNNSYCINNQRQELSPHPV